MHSLRNATWLRKIPTFLPPLHVKQQTPLCSHPPTTTSSPTQFYGYLVPFHKPSTPHLQYHVGVSPHINNIIHKTRGGYLAMPHAQCFGFSQALKEPRYHRLCRLGVDARCYCTAPPKTTSQLLREIENQPNEVHIELTKLAEEIKNLKEKILKDAMNRARSRKKLIFYLIGFFIALDAIVLLLIKLLTREGSSQETSSKSVMHSLSFGGQPRNIRPPLSFVGKWESLNSNIHQIVTIKPDGDFTMKKETEAGQLIDELESSISFWNVDNSGFKVWDEKVFIIEKQPSQRGNSEGFVIRNIKEPTGIPFVKHEQDRTDF